MLTILTNTQLAFILSRGTHKRNTKKQVTNADANTQNQRRRTKFAKTRRLNATLRFFSPSLSLSRSLCDAGRRAFCWESGSLPDWGQVRVVRGLQCCLAHRRGYGGGLNYPGAACLIWPSTFQDRPKAE